MSSAIIQTLSPSLPLKTTATKQLTSALIQLADCAFTPLTNPSAADLNLAGYSVTNVNQAVMSSNVAPTTPATNQLTLYSSGKKLRYKDDTSSTYQVATSTDLTAYLQLIGGTMTGSVNMGTNNITNVGTVSGATNSRTADNILSCSTAQTTGNLLSWTAAGKVAQDSGVVASNVVTNSGTGATGNLPTFTANKVIADSGTALSSLATTASLGSYLLKSGGTMTGAINMGAQEINNLAALRPSATNVIYGRTASAAATDNVVIGETAAASLGVGGCVVIGSGASGSFDNVVAIGRSAVSGSEGVSIGHSASAASSSNVVIGSSASASASKGVVIGVSSSCADNGVTVGRASTATADFGVILGAQSGIGANRSIVIGPVSLSFAAGANVIGDSLTNSTANSLLIGASASIRASATTCDLGTSTETFQTLYLNGSVAGPTNSRTADNIVSNAGASVSGNIASLSGVTGKLITDSGVAAASVVLGPASVVSGNIATYSGTAGKLITNAASGIGTIGAVTLANSTASINTATGAFICAGGAGITGAVFIGGTLKNTDTTASSSSTTGSTPGSAGAGALVANGGIGITKDSYFGAKLNIINNTIIGTSQTRILDTKLILQGTAANILGPHVVAYSTTDQYPVFQQLNWDHDNVSMNFDSYFSGSAWTSSFSGSNYQIQKTSNQLQFDYASGVTAGSVVPWTTAGYIDTSGILQWQKPIKTADTTASSSKTTGSIVAVAAGGLGVAGASNFGGKITVSTSAATQGLDLATSDSYANLRVIQNTTGVSDKDMYIGYQSGTGASVRLYSNATQVVYINNGNTVVGGAVTTTATDGFLYIPTVAGTKTGTPTAYSGTIPMVYDTLNHRLAVYDGASWKSVGPFT
jgi:hypothetical protein